jgi:hypothetical protein
LPEITIYFCDAIQIWQNYSVLKSFVLGSWWSIAFVWLDMKHSVTLDSFDHLHPGHFGTFLVGRMPRITQSFENSQKNRCFVVLWSPYQHEVLVCQRDDSADLLSDASL